MPEKGSMCVLNEISFTKQEFNSSKSLFLERSEFVGAVVLATEDFLNHSSFGCTDGKATQNDTQFSNLEH